jgi:hypothetical protein
LKALTNSKDCTESGIGISVQPFLLCPLLIFPSVHVIAGPLEQFSESQVVFETTSGGYLKARTSFLKKVTGRIFRLGKRFHRSKQKNYIFNFPLKKAAQL